MIERWEDIRAISIDWGCQPFVLDDYLTTLDGYHKCGFNLLVAYCGSPGLGKLANTPNESGTPYNTDNLYILEPNPAYFEEAYQRAREANNRSMGLFISPCSYTDQGWFDQRKFDQTRVNEEMRRCAKMFAPFAGIWNLCGEAEEGGDYALGRTKTLCDIVKSEVPNAMCGFLSVGNNAKCASWIDYITVQTRGGNVDWAAIDRMTGGDPVIIAEDQKATDAQAWANFLEGQKRGVIYTLTGRQFQMSTWLRERYEAHVA